MKYNFHGWKINHQKHMTTTIIIIPVFFIYHVASKKTHTLFLKGRMEEKDFFQSHALELAFSWRGCCKIAVSFSQLASWEQAMKGLTLDSPPPCLFAETEASCHFATQHFRASIPAKKICTKILDRWLGGGGAGKGLCMWYESKYDSSSSYSCST